MIRPVLEYGHIIYDNCSSSAARSLEHLQRQAAIACTGAYKHTSYKSLLSELNWEPLSDRRHTYKLITYYKIKNKIYPRYLVNLLPNPPPSNYNLRHQQPLRPTHSRLTSTYNSFFPSTTRAWNALPPLTRNTQSINIFKTLIRGINKYNPYHRLCTGTKGVWLSRIRMGLSALNAHRHKYNFINSPKCPLCNLDSETTHHYFFICPSHQGARLTFFNSLQNILGIDTSNHHSLLPTIIEGHYTHPRDHNQLLSIVFSYLEDTGRFR